MALDNTLIINGILRGMLDKAVRQGDRDKIRTIAAMIGSIDPPSGGVETKGGGFRSLLPVIKKPVWKKRNAEFPWGGWVKEGDDAEAGSGKEIPSV